MAARGAFRFSGRRGKILGRNDFRGRGARAFLDAAGVVPRSARRWRPIEGGALLLPSSAISTAGGTSRRRFLSGAAECACGVEARFGSSDEGGGAGRAHSGFLPALAFAGNDHARGRSSEIWVSAAGRNQCVRRIRLQQRGYVSGYV